MPIERSPTATPSPETVSFEGVAQHPINARTNFSSNDQPQQGESREINSNEFRLLKLPTFWHKQPKLWFAQLESEFLVFRVRSDDIKYNTVIRHLDEQALVAVSEIVENPPEKDKYLHLKNLLINRFTDSEEKRLRQLLAGIELNDRKPSELLREIKHLAGGSISENILHSIWLQRLPSRIQATLAVVEGSPLNKLAELADKIIDRDSGLQVATIASPIASTSSNLDDLERRIAALEIRHKRDRSRFRSRSQKRYRSSSRDKVSKNKDQDQICFYHKKFGEKARKCTIPCSMSKSLTEKAEN